MNSIQTAGRTVGYIRTSTQAQTVEEQRGMIEEWAVTHGRAIAEFYIDHSVSGMMPLAERPAGWRMLFDIRPGDMIIAPWLDRLFRDPLDCYEMLMTLKKRGVGLYMFDFEDAQHDICAKPMHSLLVQAAVTFAHYERGRITERIKASKRLSRARGQYLGGLPPFGYRREGERLIEDAAQQGAIALMRALRQAGKSLRAIRASMAEQGVKLALGTIASVVERDEGIAA